MFIQEDVDMEEENVAPKDNPSLVNGEDNPDCGMECATDEVENTKKTEQTVESACSSETVIIDKGCDLEGKSGNNDDSTDSREQEQGPSKRSRVGRNPQWIFDFRSESSDDSQRSDDIIALPPLNPVVSQMVEDYIADRIVRRELDNAQPIIRVIGNDEEDFYNVVPMPIPTQRIMENVSAVSLPNPPQAVNENQVDFDDPSTEISDEDEDEFELPSDVEPCYNPIENCDSSSATPESDLTLAQKSEFRQHQRQNPFPRGAITCSSSDTASSNDFIGSDEKLSSADNDDHDFLVFIPRAKPSLLQKRKCVKCECWIHKSFIHCVSCFRERRNWLPKRPPSRKLKQKKRKLAKQQVQGQSRVSQIPNKDVGCKRREVVYRRLITAREHGPWQVISRPVTLSLNTAILSSETAAFEPSQTDHQNISMPDVAISGLVTPPDSQDMNQELITEKINVECKIAKKHNEELQNPENELFKVNQLAKAVKKYKNRGVQTPKEFKDDDSKCSICFQNPKTSAFVHNKVAHFCCCYPCGDKILKKDGKCPICRSRVLRLVKMISV